MTKFSIPKEPQSLFSTLGTGFELCKSLYFRVLPLTLVLASLNTLFLSATWKQQPFPNAMPSGNPVPVAGVDLPTLITALAVGLLIFYIVMGLHAAVVYLTNSIAIKKESTLMMALYYGFGKGIPLLGVSILYMLFVWIGTILLIIPGIYIGVLLSLSLFLIVIKDWGVWDAFKDSRRLVTGNWWKTAAFCFGFAIILGLIPCLIMFSLQNNLPLAYLLHFLFLGLFYPLYYSCFMALVYDLERRKGINPVSQ